MPEHTEEDRGSMGLKSQTILFFCSRNTKKKGRYHVLSQRREIVHLIQVDLGFLHRLHAGVDGSHQSLLG